MLIMARQKQYEEGDVVLCTVKNIVGTTVFVKIDGNGEGSIVLSEIAPGRIRNLRDYVVPNKKIVCKVLKKEEDHYQLSLRRVSTKEKQKVMDEYKKEKSSEMILKGILKEKCPLVLEKIKEPIYDFLQKAKENPKLLEKICTKEEAKRILKVLKQKKEKEKEIKKEFFLRSNAPDGIKKIKKILDIKKNNLIIKYLGSSKFSLGIKLKDLRKADSLADEILEEIKKRAKQEKCEFGVKK